jgi:hypothetical protein
MQILLPLPSTRIFDSEGKTSSQFNAMTSFKRSPCRFMRPTMAKSREVRKLDQKRATSSTDRGITMRLVL